MAKTKYVPWYAKSGTDKRLKKWGGMGESQDHVLNKILDAAEKKEASCAAEPVQPVKPISMDNQHKEVVKAIHTDEPKCFIDKSYADLLNNIGGGYWDDDPKHPGYEILEIDGKNRGRRKAPNYG